MLTTKTALDLRSNHSIGCEECKSKGGFKAFLISHMKKCFPASAAHHSSSEMQVGAFLPLAAQGGSQTAPLPQAQGSSHRRSVGGLTAHPHKDCAGTACSVLFADIYSSNVLQSVSRDGGEDCFWASGCLSTAIWISSLYCVIGGWQISFCPIYIYM